MKVVVIVKIKTCVIVKTEKESIKMLDIDALRDDLKNEDLGAFFGGGFGGALMEAMDIAKASDDDVIKIAQDKGIDLNRYDV